MEPLESRTQLRRGTLLPTAPARVALVGGASSHLLTAAARADVLVRVPPGTGTLPRGTEVEVLVLDGGVVTRCSETSDEAAWAPRGARNGP